jgi:signal transduction histidine kinase
MSEWRFIPKATPPPGHNGTSSAPAILIRSLDGRITLWSPAMQKRYGFTSNEALGQVAHRLLRTVFWKPLHEVEAVLVEQKTWTGGLMHRRVDGHPITTGHRWYLHPDVTGGESLVAELHSDILQGRETAASQLADVMAIVAHELSQPMTAIANYIHATQRALEPAWTDRPRLNEALSAAAIQVERMKDSVTLFRQMSEAFRAPSDVAATECSQQPPVWQYLENDD